MTEKEILTALKNYFRKNNIKLYELTSKTGYSSFYIKELLWGRAKKEGISFEFFTRISYALNLKLNDFIFSI